jgi:hypothetical protein
MTPKKPRKRRTQTLAEKGTGEKLYAWQSVFGKAFTYAPSPDVRATIIEQDGKWIMAVKLNGQKYVGERPTLEAAFKATCNLIYKHAREFWLRMNSKAVIEHFSDFLKGEE